MTTKQLHTFVRDWPGLGTRLLRTLGRIAAVRQLENGRSDLCALVPRSIEWSMTVPDPSTEKFDRFDLHEAYRARLATHLCRQLEVAPASAGRFDDAEREALAAKLAGLHRELHGGEPADAAGQAVLPREVHAEPGLADVGAGVEAASTGRR
jgi:hypothetical protein